MSFRKYGIHTYGNTTITINMHEYAGAILRLNEHVHGYYGLQISRILKMVLNVCTEKHR